jgi:hypothetical protein
MTLVASITEPPAHRHQQIGVAGARLRGAGDDALRGEWAVIPA